MRAAGAWVALAAAAAFIISMIGLAGCQIQQCNPSVQRCSYHRGVMP